MKTQIKIDKFILSAFPLNDAHPILNLWSKTQTLLHFCSKLPEWVHHKSSRAFTSDHKFSGSVVQIPDCHLLCHFGWIFPLLSLLANVARCSCRRVTAIFHPQLRSVHSFAPFPNLVSCRSADACAAPEARDGLLRV